MKDYNRITIAYCQSSSLGQVWYRDQTGREVLKLVRHDEYKRLKATGALVRYGFVPWNP